MNQLNEILIHRLENKGFSPVAIPRFVKDVTDAVSSHHYMGLQEMNRRLELLGWGAIELDYHTLQLIIAGFEAEGF